MGVHKVKATITRQCLDFLDRTNESGKVQRIPPDCKHDRGTYEHKLNKLLRPLLHHEDHIARSVNKPVYRDREPGYPAVKHSAYERRKSIDSPDASVYVCADDKSGDGLCGQEL